MIRLHVELLQVFLIELSDLPNQDQSQLREWLENRLPEMKMLLSEIWNEADPEYPDQQASLHYELEQAIIQGRFELGDG